MKRALFICISLFSVAPLAFASGKHEGGHGDNMMTKSHWDAPKNEAEIKNPIPRTKDSIDNGRSIYMELCADCHGNKGMGDGPLADNLSTKPANLFMMSGQHKDGDLAWKIKKGKDEMPSWEEELTDKEIWDTVNYLKYSSKKKE